jgi:hypothetical protein
MLKRVRQRLQREWDEYAHTPEIKLGRLFKGMRQREGKQIFRSLVQVNFYPRESTAELPVKRRR